MNKVRLLKSNEVPERYKKPFKVRDIPAHTIREIKASDRKQIEEPRTAFNALFLT